jgi:hypothetical protein
MGRGPNSQTTNSASVASRFERRGTARTRTVSADQIAEINAQNVDATVVLPNGEMIDAPDNAAVIAKGLVDVVSAKAEGRDRYRIRFHDGTEALVDLRAFAVALTSNDAATDVQIQGALAAAIAQQARRDAHSSDPLTLEIGDIHTDYDRHNSGDLNPEHLAELASSILEDFRRRGDVTVNPPHLHRALRPQRPRASTLPVSAREQYQMLAAEAEQRLAHAYRLFGADAAGRALIFPIDPETGEWVGGTYIGVTDADLERRRQLAIRDFGGEDAIPRSGMIVNRDGTTSGMFDLSAQDIEAFQRLGGRILAGQRFFDLIGPAGSGKDTWVREVAAKLGYPVVQFNIGPTYELEDALGGHGLQGIKVVDMQTGEEEIVTGSVTSFGPLARALQKECLVVIQEPEGQEEDLVRIHGLLGDNIGPKGEDINPRRGMVSSPTGNALFQAHPGNLVFVTRNPQADESGMRDSTMDRSGHFDFEYRDDEVEARRLARMVTYVMRNQFFTPRDSAIIRDYTADELMPMVEIMKRFRVLHAESPHEFVDVPGARKMVEVYTQMLLQAYGRDNVADDTTKELLSPYFPPTDSMPREYRNDLLANQVYSGRVSSALHAMIEAVNDISVREDPPEHDYTLPEGQ